MWHGQNQPSEKPWGNFLAYVLFTCTQEYQKVSHQRVSVVQLSCPQDLHRSVQVHQEPMKNCSSTDPWPRHWKTLENIYDFSLHFAIYKNISPNERAIKVTPVYYSCHVAIMCLVDSEILLPSVHLVYSLWLQSSHAHLFR